MTRASFGAEAAGAGARAWIARVFRVGRDLDVEAWRLLEVLPRLARRAALHQHVEKEE